MAKFKVGGIVSPTFKPEFKEVEGIRVCTNAHEMVLTKEQAAELAHLAAIPFPKDAPVISANDFKNLINQNL